MHLLIQKHLYICCLLLCFLFVGQTYAQTAVTCTISIQSDQASNICQGENITLNARPGANFTPSGYQWFLDGNPITNATGQTYETNVGGTYTVEATGASCTGVVASGQFTVTVDPKPARPTFNISPTGAICSGTEVTFNVVNPEPDVIYVWTFGNGNTVSSAGPVTQTYESTGTGSSPFDIQVYGVNRQGCSSDTLTQTLNVRQEPEISFTEANDFQVCLPDSVEPSDTTVFAEITNTTQAPFLGDIARYYVNWGIEEDEVEYLPGDFPIKNPTPYDTIGNYPIRIRAVNRNGCEAVFEQVFSYSQEPKADFTLDNKERVEEDQVPPCVPVRVTPTDSSSGGNLSYRWAIQPEQGWFFESGDSVSSNPVFIFEKSGVYNIEMIVENGCGTDTAMQSIVVGWPQVQLPASTTVCGPTTIDYSSSGTGGGGGIPGGGGTGGLFVDKNLGEQITVTISITGPTSTTRTFNSDTFDFKYDFTTPGKYTVVVEAVNECGSSNSIYQGQPAPVQEVIILQQPAAPTIQAPGAVCEGDTVRLAPSGPGPIYAWFESDLPEAIPITTGPTFTTPSLTADITYYVAAVDTANGVICISPKTPVPINVVPGITNNTIAVEQQEVQNVCVGETPAALTGSTPTGGDTSVPYSYTWELSTTGPTGGFTAAPGVNNTINYTPTAPVTGNTWFRRLVFSGSCTADTSNVVSIIAVDPVPASANTIGPAQELCEGDTPAPLIGSRPTGGGGSPYTYLWEVSSLGPEEGFVTAPGTSNEENYTIPAGALNQSQTWIRRAVTSGGCTSYSDPIAITVFPAIENNTISDNQVVCTGTAPEPLTGSAPTGGNGNYTYQWLSSTLGPDRGFAAAAGTNTSQSYTPGNITQTTYYTRVVTAGDCTPDTSAVITIEVNQGILNNSITASQPSVCAGQTVVVFQGSTPTGGTGAYTYLWESSTSGPDVGFNPAPGVNDGISYTSSTLTQNTWFRRVVSSQGCSRASEPIEITTTPLPENPVLTVQNATACPDSPATLEVANPNGDLTYEWYNAPTGGSAVFVGPSFTTPNLQQSTTYYVQAVNTNTCTSASRTEATVTVVPPVADAGEGVTIIQGRTAELRASGGVSYVWEPAESLNNPNIANPVATPDETTTYTVTITTAEGCTATDEVTVEVIPAIVVPNAFTPNRDNVNEVWEIENYQNFPDMRVEVFNRWGNKIFSSTGYGTPWDGTYNGEVLPVATYYYIIYLNSSEKPISGNVTIIR